ncbi:hypothetical protein Cgig2_018254 [Carnegiea gigantea]|uniref:Polygalacturonase n=1 Tax=Carnegiea gigantea TaxID=171969 RepID=A0A9Q1QTD7_9CARY|nr:hypothetical protein Cgig2_018254 [Carnegiea gigantea]
MKGSKCLSIPYLIVFLASLHISFSVVSIEAWSSSHRNNYHHQKHENGRSWHHGPTPVAPSPPSYDSNTFNALIKAWEAACEVEGGTVEIPAGYTFFIRPLTLQGPCMPGLLLKIDGTIVAPPEISSWSESELLEWINIKWVQNFTIQGNGLIDGRGSEWWDFSKALRFYSSLDVTVRDIRIVNSPQCHLKFDSSARVKVLNVSLYSPEDSPNTDGIHLQETTDVEISHSTIACGDDCISIQTGCSNVHVHHITCGPGHGISLGGLGRNGSFACVSDIVVENIRMHATQFGVRIKTWQGGKGSVKNVSFSSIRVSNVKVPLDINQYYCENHNNCENLTGTVAISNIEFSRIWGTYSGQPILFTCSDEVPCVNVNLVDVQLKPTMSHNRGGRIHQALCQNSYGKTESPLMPSSIHHCLRGMSGVAEVGVQNPHEELCQYQLGRSSSVDLTSSVP